MHGRLQDGEAPVQLPGHRRDDSSARRASAASTWIGDALVHAAVGSGADKGNSLASMFALTCLASHGFHIIQVLIAADQSAEALPAPRA